MGTSERHLDHPALLYGDLEELLDVTAPFVTAGLDDDEVAFVAARGDHLPALRERVGERAGAVRWTDTDEWHPHPNTRLRAFHELVTDELARGAKGFRLVGEPVWPDGRPALEREWQRYESSLNVVLAPFPVTLLCLYDAARLDPSITATARRTHPRVHEGGALRHSEDYEDPTEFLRHWAHELSPPPWRAAQVREVADLSEARRFLGEEALRAGVGPERVTDLCVAANEVIANAMVHAGGAPTLRAWSEAGYFVCEVEDHGAGIADPLAAYRPPAAGTSGYGLWLARQLVDLLQIVPGPSGTTVRLQIPSTNASTTP